MHLTNVAIQRAASTYDEDAGMKWPLASLKCFLIAKHGKILQEPTQRHNGAQLVWVSAGHLHRSVVDELPSDQIASYTPDVVKFDSF